MNRKRIKKLLVFLITEVLLLTPSIKVSSTEKKICNSTETYSSTIYPYSNGNVYITYDRIDTDGINIVDLRYCSNPGMKVVDSYNIKDLKSIKEIIDIMLDYNKDGKYAWNRDAFSMEIEWLIHNFCYDLGILTNHTADTDFNNDELKLFK